MILVFLTQYSSSDEEDDVKVLDICANIPKGPLHTVTIHDDTVIHIAAYHKKNDLVLSLLNMVPSSDSHRLTWQNSSGSTFLHETGTNNKTVGAAREMLRRAPMLLSVTNKERETALFYAACHGKTKIFRFLHGEVTRTYQGPDLKTFLVRDDKSTILHVAILSGNYLKTLCTTLDQIKLNSRSLTAERLFNENNNARLKEAKEWMIESAKNYTVVAVLIATVAFAAEYTVPGADAISLSAALTSVIMFLNIITSSYRFKDFEKSLVRKLKVGMAMLMVSVAMLMVAFAATLVLTISSGQKWTDITFLLQIVDENLEDTSWMLSPLKTIRKKKFACEWGAKLVKLLVKMETSWEKTESRLAKHRIKFHQYGKSSSTAQQDEITAYESATLCKGKIDNDSNTLLHMVGEEIEDADTDLKGHDLVLQENMQMFKV
ncbi:hypothetical protein L1987_12709 [Smallanthus sonchifolius]|uniref:Uncharacterized protein n=1 Tax=Smallanthus sonchifolius TaxID=185202 RepID=A0ACB9JEI2_9ASTR|nr:hypothetical protein L1987_12709 [Smallanthus sonchifolius]